MAAPSVMRRTLPLALTAFFSSFSSCGFKVWVVLAVLGSSFDYFRDSAFVLSVVGVCVLPSLFLPMVSGFLADRFPKRYVVIVANLLELPVFCFGAFSLSLTYLGEAGGYLILGVVLLYSILAVFATPAFDGLLPETFSEPELSKAYSRIISAGTLGFISGAAVILVAFHFGLCFYILLVVLLLSGCSSVSILPVISPVQKQKELAYSFKSTLAKGVAALRSRPGLLAAAIGEVCFIGLGVASIPLLVLFGRYALQIISSANITLLQMALGIGFFIGCFSAGLLSSKKIELGLVPLGALGMAVALPMIVFFPGHADTIGLDLPGELAVDIYVSFHAGALCWTAFAGFSGGLFLVPLRTFILQGVKPEFRGAALAVKNAAAFAIGSVALLLAVSCALGGGLLEGLPPVFASITSVMPRVSFKVLLIGFGLTVFGFTALSMWLLPNFMLRFIILALGHSLYRLKITGAENIPERGPALLLCNHVSVVDSVLISACTSREIRFMLYEEYFDMPLIGAIARMTGFFRVPSVRTAKSLEQLFGKVRQHLADGGLVCSFPEGRLSGNGLMREFKSGHERMLPENVDVPIIPVNISFAWGNMFSNFFTRQGSRRKVSFPFFSAVTFGKPVSPDMSRFEIRQKIAELGAEASQDELPDEVTLHHAAVKMARRHPVRKIFSDCDGNAYSAMSLVADAALLSRYIRNHVPSAEQYVGTLLPNGTAAVKAMLAILMADKTPVPLNYSTSQAVFDRSVEKAGISLIITSGTFLDKIRVTPLDKGVCIEDLEKDFSFLGKLIMQIGIFCLPTAEFMNMISPLSAFDLKRDAALLFSSGSTGNPKGVCLTHHNLNSNARSVAGGLAVDSSDMVVGNLPLFHSFGLNVCFWMPLLYHVPVVYVANPLDSSAVRAIISERKATLLFATPSFLQKYLQRCKGEELVSLRLIATGAEKLRADIAAKVRELTGGRLEIVECYGCTELSPVVSINLARNVADLGSKVGSRDSIGLPLENVSVRILDPLNFTPVEQGEEGILCVKGSLVMRGYLNDEKLTREVMAGDYYITGDIARMDKHGYIHICGRLSRFSKIAGEMVPHELVERTINEMCACDNRVVAVGGLPDPSKGEALLVLYTDEMPFTPEQIVDQLRERSISNLWIPRAKNFHKVDSLPLLGSGKLDLSLLRKIAEEIAQREGLNTQVAGQ